MKIYKKITMTYKERGEKMIPDWLIKFMKWIEEHPYKTMFFIQMPLSIITSLLTIMLLM